MKRAAKWAAGLFVAIVTIFLIFDIDDVIDLPSWMNVGGVDIPIVGDTDKLDCRLTETEDGRVQIRIVDGDRETYGDFQYAWRNGYLIDSSQVEKPADDTFLVPTGVGEQYYAISIEPDEDARNYCESIVIG
ncbi:MAG: hypothetical protein HKN94_00435 [Acidimicrobiales bacterium]|nr:hypothetical protein [Acidimicrobiales bacterium]RZV43805.1 MAG: hypothetical protein EX269_12655 [Acidimicrobiales bacterium]